MISFPQCCSRLPADPPSRTPAMQAGVPDSDYPRVPQPKNRQKASDAANEQFATSTLGFILVNATKKVTPRKTGSNRARSVPLPRPAAASSLAASPSSLRRIKAGSPSEIKLPVNEFLRRRPRVRSDIRMPQFVRPGYPLWIQRVLESAGRRAAAGRAESKKSLDSPAAASASPARRPRIRKLLQVIAKKGFSLSFG